MSRMPVTLADQGIFIDPDDADELTDLLADAAWVISCLAGHPAAEDACSGAPARPGSCAELAIDLRQDRHERRLACGGSACAALDQAAPGPGLEVRADHDHDHRGHDNGPGHPLVPDVQQPQQLRYRRDEKPPRRTKRPRRSAGSVIRRQELSSQIKRTVVTVIASNLAGSLSGSEALSTSASTRSGMASAVTAVHRSCCHSLGRSFGLTRSSSRLWRPRGLITVLSQREPPAADDEQADTEGTAQHDVDQHTRPPIAAAASAADQDQV